MSNAEMLDTCVRFILENHHLVTDEHIEMLDKLWHYKYETATTAEMTRQQAAEKPLPPSPPPEPEFQMYGPADTSLMCWCDGNMCHMCYRVADDTVLAEAQAQQQQEQPQQAEQCIPQIFPVEVPEPKKPHSPIYTNYRWPSPIAKVFVQHIRGNNAWQYRYKGCETWRFDFKKVWHSSGNTELKLTHDNCMRYLAYRMGLTPQQLMEKTPMDVHARLIGEYHGVPGYYTKRYYY